jgi:hypothetical protein
LATGEAFYYFTLCTLAYFRPVHAGNCPSYLDESVEQASTRTTGSDIRSADNINCKLACLRTAIGEFKFSFSIADDCKTLPAVVILKRHRQSHLLISAFADQTV